MGCDLPRADRSLSIVMATSTCMVRELETNYIQKGDVLEAEVNVS